MSWCVVMLMVLIEGSSIFNALIREIVQQCRKKIAGLNNLFLQGDGLLDVQQGFQGVSSALSIGMVTIQHSS